MTIRFLKYKYNLCQHHISRFNHKLSLIAVRQRYLGNSHTRLLLDLMPLYLHIYSLLPELVLFL